MDTERRLSASSENLTDPTGPKEKKGGLAGIFKRSSSFGNLLDEDKNIFSGMFKRSAKPAEEGSNATGENTTLFGSTEDLLEANPAKEKTGGFTGFFKKSPKPSPRSVATEDPLTKQLSSSWDSLTEAGNDNSSSRQELSASTDNLCDTSSTTKEGEDATPPAGRRLSRKRTIKKKRRVVSFRVKKTLPRMFKEKSSEMPVIEESVEMENLNTPQESTVVVEPVEMAAYPTEESVTQMEQENNELMEWWNSVKGWTEWNETSNFQEEDEQIAMQQAADRVYMAARVFVHFFNQRGASLQHRILELLSMADAADEFHRKTVSAAVGGGVASVAGSVATITGLILAPFTFGTSIIVTAVGIGVATAGSITSATANITDTVHSNMDRKKVEKMIQGYQEEIQDIRKCLEFVQEGMNTLEEWDFEKYSESAAKKALNHNIKHVMKEGGRAGKALMINTDKLISTVQILGAAGGAAKAVKAVSVTTGVMSALFLALDIFFLAKDSHTLHKGAKTKFAAKIRQVCKDLQEGLLELNKVKTQLQKTMDGVEVEEYEDIEEVEVEVEDEFESDPKKLAELEQEIDFLEEKLGKKEEEVEPKKSKETTALDIFKIKKEKKEEKSMKEKDVEEKKEDEEPKKSKESVLDMFKIKKKEEKSVNEKEMEEEEKEPKKSKESALDMFKIKKEKKEENSVEKTGEMEEKKEDEEPKKSKESVLDMFKIKKKEEKSMKEHEVEEKEEKVEPKKSKEMTALDFFKIKKEKKEEKRVKENDVEDKREDEEPKKSKESVLDMFKIKKEKKEEKSVKEQEVEEKDKGEKMSESKSEKKVNETSVKAEKDVLKEQFEKGSKKEKEPGNQTSSGKKPEEKPEKSKEPNKTPEIKMKPENEQKERTIQHAEEEKSQRRTETSRRHSSRSEKDGEKHETRERREERGSHHRDRESWRRRGEEETGRKDSHRSHRDEESPKERKTSHHVRENEERSGRVENARRFFERAAGDQHQEKEEERRRGSGREHRHSRKGSRSKYDGLNI
ncbi:eukaryotic translation initiation factor 3 subunit A-like [Gambusia affinis]|uniref:eukaryotic translation initiation factor 3 subunit A-like n=1 Tax=Gambusia affinis TaxID=33528 RepID=UPI001CDC414A|nr:eukaryotic translation initiation factor 3 subunit A-like [Gambusia affinis]XP_043989631.1 eukaryotic translation initiation factor 3 subunit A-like [Gambusia affinis]